MNRVRLPARWLVRTFGATILLLAVAHLAMQVVRYHLGYHEFYGLVRLFDMDAEANLPTSFSALQLLLACALLAVIGSLRRQAGAAYARHWLFLALILLLMAVDEMSAVHELSVRPLRVLAPTLVTGLFYWAWVIPAVVLVGIVAWSYAGFVFRYLPRETRNTTVVGAALFVGGAVGIEMPEARFVEQHGMENFTYSMFVLVEETLEKIGILVFLAGLLKYFSRHVGVVELEVDPRSPAAAAQAPRPDLLDSRPVAM